MGTGVEIIWVAVAEAHEPVTVLVALAAHSVYDGFATEPSRGAGNRFMPLSCCWMTTRSGHSGFLTGVLAWAQPSSMKAVLVLGPPTAPLWFHERQFWQRKTSE